MADRGRPFFRSRRYTPALPEAVQPPDDRTYSAEVTVFQRNLPHHRSARAESPYTCSIMIPCASPFVKNFFRIFHEVLYLFSVKTENSFLFLPPLQIILELFFPFLRCLLRPCEKDHLPIREKLSSSLCRRIQDFINFLRICFPYAS